MKFKVLHLNQADIHTVCCGLIRQCLLKVEGSIDVYRTTEFAVWLRHNLIW